MTTPNKSPTITAAPVPAVETKAAAKPVPAKTKPKAKAAAVVKAPVAKSPAAKPTAKPTVAKPAQKAAVSKPVVPKPVAAAKSVAPAKPKKIKMVRDSLTMPKPEYAVLDDLKQRGAKLASPVKKTELIRAGIKALAAMNDAAFLAALRAVPSLKTGRPAKK